MWNDTEIPLAYLFTFRCYGTWLHGDERGAVDRFHRAYQSPFIEPNERWRNYAAELLKSDPVILNAVRREAVEIAVREPCDLRNCFYTR